MIHLEPGDRYGRLTIISPAPPSVKYPRKRMWLCRCDCGQEVAYPASYIAHGAVTSCGCGRSLPRASAEGERHGSLVGVRATGTIKDNSAVWIWLCDCGNTVEATLDAVRWCGRTSCGCSKRRSELVNAKAARAAQSLVDGTLLSSIDDPGKLQCNNTSGVRGVSWHKGTGMWAACIGFNGKRIWLGYYKTVEDAAKARHQAEDHIYGDFLAWYADAHPEEWEAYCKRRDRSK